MSVNFSERSFTSVTDVDTDDVPLNSEVSEGEYDKVEPHTSNILTDNRPTSPKNCHSRWFEKPVYKRYWKHYRYMQDWFNQHHTVVHGLNSLSISGSRNNMNSYMYSVILSQWSRYYYDQFVNQYWMHYQNKGQDYGAKKSPVGAKTDDQNVFKKPHPPVDRPKQQQQSRKSRKRKDNHREKGRSSKQSQKRRRQHSVSSCKSSQSQQSQLSRQTTTSGSQEMFEMEITGEMMDFFAKSAKHKKEMAALKKKKREEEEETGDYIPLTAATTGRRTTAAPSERPGVRRTAEMKQLYGTGAAMIHGMETAMQLSYDRHFDIHQPKLWPNLPLNIKF